jgi:hypothetical protein
MSIENDFLQQRLNYRIAVINYLNNFESENQIKENIINTIVNLLMFRDGILPTAGSFVQSVENNDLFSAVTKADSDNLEQLRIIVLAHKYCYLSDYLNPESKI